MKMPDLYGHFFQKMKKIINSLIIRLQILWILLSKWQIWPALTEIWRYRARFHEIRGEIEPFGFVRSILGNGSFSPPPDFNLKLGSIGSFTPPEFTEVYSSEPSVSSFLGQLVYYKKPAVVVELGAYVGWTSAHLAYALQSNQTGHLYYVDIIPKNLEIATSNLRKLGLADVATGLLGETLAASVTDQLPSKIDVVFIDASHHYEETKAEILFYATRLAPGGCIILHDSLSFPGVRQALAETAAQFRSLTFSTEKGNGVTVLMAKS